MTPVLVNRSQISDICWNDHIRRSEQCVIYAYSFYLDVVSNGWKALVWPSAQDYLIVMPLPVKRKAGKTIVYQPLFCQYLGLFSVNELTTFQLEAFLKSLSLHFSYISTYSFNPENSELIKKICFRFDEFEVKEQHTYWLRLEQGYSKIYNQYSKDRKLNVKRGRQNGWTMQESRDIQPLVRLFRENHAARIPGGVNPDAYQKLKLLFEQLNYKAELWYAEKNNRIHAGILLVKNSERVIYLFNAADKSGRTGNARTFLLDHYFSVNAGNPLIFDFESPEVSSIASFYESFGGEKKAYFTIRKNGLAFPFRQIQEWRRNHMLKTM
jgi:hypothetical protein